MSQLSDLDGLITTALTPILALTTPKVRALQMQPMFSIDDAYDVVKNRNLSMPAILFCNAGEAASSDPRSLSTQQCQVNSRFQYIVAVLNDSQGDTTARFNDFHYLVRDRIISLLAGIVYTNPVVSSTFNTRVAFVEYLGMEQAVNQPDLSAVLYRFQFHTFYDARKAL
jgi:hypothetical protein